MEADKSWVNTRALELALQTQAQSGKQETDETILERAKKFKEFLSA